MGAAAAVREKGKSFSGVSEIGNLEAQLEGNFNVQSKDSFLRGCNQLLYL